MARYTHAIKIAGKKGILKFKNRKAMLRESKELSRREIKHRKFTLVYSTKRKMQKLYGHNLILR